MPRDTGNTGNTGRGNRRFTPKTETLSPEIKELAAHNERNASALRTMEELIRGTEFEEDQQEEKFNSFQNQIRDLRYQLKAAQESLNQKEAENQKLQEQLATELAAREQAARDQKTLQKNIKKLNRIKPTVLKAFLDQTKIRALAENPAEDQKSHYSKKQEQLDQLNGLLDGTPETLRDEFRNKAEVILYKKIAREALAAKTAAETEKSEAQAEAKKERGEAQAARTEAETARGEALAAKAEAETARGEALAAKAEAETARADKATAEIERGEALAAQKAAETQRDVAIAAQKAAEIQKSEAIAAKTEAEIQKSEAIAAKTEAETQKSEAQAAQKTAETQKSEALARAKTARAAQAEAEDSSRYDKILSSALLEIRTSGLKNVDLDNIPVLESDPQDSKVINSVSEEVDIASLTLSQKLQALKNLSVDKDYLPSFNKVVKPKLQVQEQAYEKMLRDKVDLIDKMDKKNKLSKAFNAWRSQVKIEKLSRTLEEISGIIDPQSSDRKQEDEQEQRKAEFTDMNSDQQKDFMQKTLSTVETLKNSIDTNKQNDLAIEITQKAMLEFLSLKKTITSYYNEYAESKEANVLSAATSMLSIKNSTEKQAILAAALSASPDFRSSLAATLKDISILTKVYVKSCDPTQREEVESGASNSVTAASASLVGGEKQTRTTSERN
ncbi:hypothetical protein N9O56_00300 [Rickettsiales bacterium]|nr:hypothetical protein [Rickettsiales bacterium]